MAAMLSAKYGHDERAQMGQAGARWRDQHGLLAGSALPDSPPTSDGGGQPSNGQPSRGQPSNGQSSGAPSAGMDGNRQASPMATDDGGASDDSQPKPPSDVSFKKQGGDGLCAYYALHHFRKGALEEGDFIETAEEFYHDRLELEGEELTQFVKDGNDPGLLQAFGLSKKSFGSDEAYIVADVARKHFWTLRQNDDAWWRYDSLKAGPELIGSEDAVKAEVTGLDLYA